MFTLVLVLALVPENKPEPLEKELPSFIPFSMFCVAPVPSYKNVEKRLSTLVTTFPTVGHLLFFCSSTTSSIDHTPGAEVDSRLLAGSTAVALIILASYRLSDIMQVLRGRMITLTVHTSPQLDHQNL